MARFGTLGRVPAPFLLRSDNGLVFTSRSYTALVHSYGLRQEFIRGTAHSRMAWSNVLSARSRNNACIDSASRRSSMLAA